MCLCASVATFAQTQPSFSIYDENIQTGPPLTAYAVDVNNDGVPDIIRIGLDTGNTFTVYLSDGNGSFNIGYSYSFSSEAQSGISMASGDFNGDGKLDLIFVINGTSQIAVFLGNGDGTFANPTFDTVAIPSTYILSGIAAADFNGDGKLDLILSAYAGIGKAAVFLAVGAGNGSFGSPKQVATGNTTSSGIQNIVVGDFDGDGKGDFAFSDIYNCGSAYCYENIRVEYGDATGNFEDSTAFTSSNQFQFAAGDLNSDSLTDLFGYTSVNPQLFSLYGQRSRTFNLYTQSVSLSSNQSLYGNPVMADFNGDGHMDIGVLSTDYNTANQIQIYSGTSNPGAFTLSSISAGYYQYITAPVTGDFNKDTKPDLVWMGETESGNGAQDSHMLRAFNTSTEGNWGGCPYPTTGEGIHLCSDLIAYQTDPVFFYASANSYGQLRKMELWIDGSKTAEQWIAWEHNAWLNFYANPSQGPHNATLYAVNVDNTLLRYDFTFTVGNGCSAPSSPGVHVCSPTNGSTVSSPVQTSATATITGTIERMEIWVDGVKEYTTASNELTTSLTLSSGNHRLDYYAVNTAGQKWETTIYVTAK